MISLQPFIGKQVRLTFRNDAVYDGVIVKDKENFAVANKDGARLYVDESCVMTLVVRKQSDPVEAIVGALTDAFSA